MNQDLPRATRDLVSLVLGKATANRLSDEQALRRLRAAGSVSELVREHGLSYRAALRTLAVLELSRRIESVSFTRGARFSAPADVYQHGRTLGLEDLGFEQFWIVMLDGKNRVMESVLVSQGSLTGAIVHPREVFCPAVRSRAAGVVFLHNHPSGDPTPSLDDVEITERLCAVGRILGISVHDHVIVGRCGYVSFVERGLLTEIPEE